MTAPAAWVAYHGIATKDGVAVVYKAVSQELAAGHRHTPTTYAIDSTVEATDWDPDPGCGPGLHFSPTPFHASLYYQGIGEPPSCRVLHEVDQFGAPVVDALDTEQETMP